MLQPPAAFQLLSGSDLWESSTARPKVLYKHLSSMLDELSKCMPKLRCVLKYRELKTCFCDWVQRGLKLCVCRLYRQYPTFEFWRFLEIPEVYQKQLWCERTELRWRPHHNVQSREQKPIACLSPTKCWSTISCVGSLSKRLVLLVICFTCVRFSSNELWYFTVNWTDILGSMQPWNSTFGCAFLTTVYKDVLKTESNASWCSPLWETI